MIDKSLINVIKPPIIHIKVQESRNVEDWIRDELIPANPGLRRDQVHVSNGQVDFSYQSSPGLQTTGFGRVFQHPMTMTTITLPVAP